MSQRSRGTGKASPAWALTPRAGIVLNACLYLSLGGLGSYGFGLVWEIGNTW